MFELPSVCFAQSPLLGRLRVRTQWVTVADGVTSPKTRCPWGWAEGGPGRTTGQLKYAGFGLAPSPFVVGLTPTYAGTNLGCHNSWSRVPRRGKRASPWVLRKAPPGASAAQHPASPPPRWQPSCAQAATSSSLPLLPRAAGRGGWGGLGGQLCRALAFCVSSPSKTAAGARSLGALARPSPAAAQQRPGKLRP